MAMSNVPPHFRALERNYEQGMEKTLFYLSFTTHLFSNDGNDEEEDFSDTSSVTSESKPMANNSDQLATTHANEEEGHNRKFLKHSSVHPSRTINSLVTDGSTLKQLCCQERRIAELQAELSKLHKTVAKLKHKKSQLQYNIGLYFGQCGGTSVDALNAHNVPRGQRTQSGARQKGLDCIHAVQSLVSCIEAVETGNRSNKILNKLAGDIIDIIWDKSLLGGRI
ncbi:hypothetical protein ACA910_013808 [Epithemia clementina (nom. ined.)]